MNALVALWLAACLCITWAAPVLVVMSSGGSLRLQNGAYHATGYYLDELFYPSSALVSAGYELVFANPQVARLDNAFVLR